MAEAVRRFELVVTPADEFEPAEPDTPEPDEGDDPAQAVRCGVYAVLDTAAPLDLLVAEHGPTALNGDQLIEVRRALAETVEHLASVQAAVDAAANRWVWDHGTVPDGRHRSPVCEMGGETWKAALTGQATSLKKDDKARLASTAADRLAAFIVASSGADPGSDFDTSTRMLLSIAMRELTRAFTFDPQARVLAQGSPGVEADGVPWAIDVAGYRTPSTGARRRTVVKWSPEPGDEEGEG